MAGRRSAAVTRRASVGGGRYEVRAACGGTPLPNSLRLESWSVRVSGTTTRGSSATASRVVDEPRFTADEWRSILGDPIRDKAYQRTTRLGGSVRDYLVWKRPEAAERSLEIYEGYLAELCMHLMLHHGDPVIGEVTAPMLLDAAQRHPIGSYGIVRTSYRGFFGWAEDWADVLPNPARRLPRKRPQPAKVYEIFTPVEQAKLIKAAERLPLPWVQRLRVLCFVDLGIRSEEARGLQPSDFDLAQRVVVVKGKGDKERVIPFGDDTFRAFIAYRNRPIPNVRMTDKHGPYRDARAPLDDDYLFFPYGQNKRAGVTWTDPFRQMSSRGLRSWWTDKVVATAGVKYRSLHMNRHTMGTNLSDAGEPLETIQDWLGHADPSTSKIYVHNSRSRLKRGRGALDDYRKAQGE